MVGTVSPTTKGENPEFCSFALYHHEYDGHSTKSPIPYRNIVFTVLSDMTVKLDSKHTDSDKGPYHWLESLT